MLENRSLLRQPADMGSANLCVSIGFQMIRSQGVDRDEDDVSRLGILGPKKYPTREKANKLGWRIFFRNIFLFTEEV